MKKSTSTIMVVEMIDLLRTYNILMASNPPSMPCPSKESCELTMQNVNLSVKNIVIYFQSILFSS
jgi:hypothetical protein